MSLYRNLQHVYFVHVEMRLDSSIVKALQVKEFLSRPVREKGCLLFFVFSKKAFCGLTEHCSFLCFLLSFFWE